ncbi:MAG: transglutaminase domain-containing protein [Oscillospiraceae bacterium]|nr:transglutaminase domain-containing protein [Oscillospiraceae bacterium]
MARKSSIKLSPPDNAMGGLLPFEWGISVLLSVAIFTGFGGSLIGMLSLPVHGWILALAGVAAAAVLELYVDKVKELLITLGGILAASIALWALASKYTRAGLSIVFNAFTRLVSLRELLILAEYEVLVPADKYAISVTLFLLPLALMLSLLCTVFVRINFAPFPAALGLFVLFMMFTTGSFNGAGWLLLLFLAFGIMLCRKNLAGYSRLSLSIPAAALCLSVVLFSAFAPSLSDDFARLRIDASEYSHRLKYEGAENPLTEGDLTKASGFSPSNEVAMTITFEEPTYVYLRGHVKSELIDGVWHDLPAETYYNNRALFYQLYRDGFYTDTQLGHIAQILRYPIEKKLRSAVINIEGACTEVAYVPYTILEAPESMLTDDRLNDLGLYPAEDEFTVEWLPELVEELHMLEDRFERDRIYASDELKEYIKLENRYRTFVYNEYLRLDDETHAILSKYLSGGADIGFNRLDYDNAKKGVRSLVEQIMGYSDGKPDFDGSLESLDKLLTNGGNGYSQQFASLGTLLMRYYGIPARYVEGYLVTHADASKATAGEPFDVTMKNAHAWIEYYRDGLGWIPLEVTPGFYTDGEVKGDPPPAEDPPPPPEKEDPPKPPEDSEPPEEEPFKVPEWAWAIFVLALIVVAWLLLRKHVLEKREETFLGSDTHLASVAMLRFLMRILSLQGFEPTGPSLYSLGPVLINSLGNEHADKYGLAIDISSKAEFAANSVSDAERSELYDIVKFFITDLDSHVDKFRRFVFRYLLWLY